MPLFDTVCLPAVKTDAHNCCFVPLWAMLLQQLSQQAGRQIVIGAQRNDHLPLVRWAMLLKRLPQQTGGQIVIAVQRNDHLATGRVGNTAETVASIGQRADCDGCLAE